MKLHVDKQADALNLRLDDSATVESKEVSPGILVDYDESNEDVSGGPSVLYYTDEPPTLLG